MPRYMDTPTEASVLQAGEKFGYPLMLKAKRMAYDGKGNAPVKDKVRSTYFSCCCLTRAYVAVEIKLKNTFAGNDEERKALP